VKPLRAKWRWTQGVDGNVGQSPRVSGVGVVGNHTSLLERSVIEGDNPVFDTDYQGFVMCSQRVELFVRFLLSYFDK